MGLALEWEKPQKRAGTRAGKSTEPRGQTTGVRLWSREELLTFSAPCPRMLLPANRQCQMIGAGEAASPEIPRRNISQRHPSNLMMKHMFTLLVIAPLCAQTPEQLEARGVSVAKVTYQGKSAVRLEALPDVKAARARTAASIARLPQKFRNLEDAGPYPVDTSKDLEALIERTRRNLT